MKGYWQLTLAQLRLFARNRQMLLWSVAFPVFFMVILGLFFNSGNSLSMNLVLIDKDGSEASRTFVQAMRNTQVLELRISSDEEEALSRLKHGDEQLVVIIPQGYEAALHAAPGQVRAAEIEVYYDDTNMAASEIGKLAVTQVVDAISKQMTNYIPVVTVHEEGVQSLNLKYIDFIVPGIVAMMIMSNNLNGVAGQIASWRERGVLRRMQSTPLKASSFIAAQISARLILSTLQASIVLLIASWLFGTQINGSWLLLLSFVIFGTLAFISIGFIIASLAKTPESAGPIAGFISFPMLFMGGVFFPVKNLPEWLQPVIQLLPISHLTTALRQVMNVGAGWLDLWSEALLLGGWMAVAFAVSAFTFKWE